MKSLKLKISHKLPLLMTCLAAFSVIVVGTIIVKKATDNAMIAAKEKLVDQKISRVSALSSYLTSIEQDLSSLSHSEYVRQALFDLTDGWNEIGIQGDQTKILQELYIDNNPNPTGQKENLDYAKDGSSYSKAHKKYHKWFRHFMRQRDYGDIFLFTTDGDLVYTVFKELDYATNLNNGKWADSDLGNAFRAARDNPKTDFQAFFDFKPYAPIHGVPASFISQPILNDNGSLAGVLVFQMPTARINAVMHVAAGMGDSGETYIVGRDYLMRSDSRFSEESTILKTKITGLTVDLALEGKIGSEMILDYRGIPVLSAYGSIDFNGVRWAVLAEVNESEIMRPIYEMERYALLSTIGVLMVSLLVALYFSKKISKPITLMSNSMRELASGNFDVDIPGVERNDEIGQMAASVQVFKDKGIEAKKLQEEQEEIGLRNEKDKKRMMHEMADQFDEQVGGTIKSLSEAAEELQNASRSMEGIALQTQDASSSVASAAEETSANVSTVASATEEMTASAQEISTQVTDVASKSNMAATSASATSQKVNDLNGLVENIGEVVEAIKGIADQTNLLALNATIEAARAGDAGKGFAVVAEEVKKLAGETAQKTEEIETRITEIQAATQDSVQAMQEIIKNISDIDQASSGTASAVEEQNSVIAEITRNINEVSQAAQQVASEIGNVQTAAGETGQSSHMLKTSADNIANLSESLDKSVRSFLSQIRS